MTWLCCCSRKTPREVDPIHAMQRENPIAAQLSSGDLRELMQINTNETELKSSQKTYTHIRMPTPHPGVFKE